MHCWLGQQQKAGRILSSMMHLNLCLDSLRDCCVSRLQRQHEHRGLQIPVPLLLRALPCNVQANRHEEERNAQGWQMVTMPSSSQIWP